MLPWEFYLQDTIPYTLVCHVTPDPNTRFKRKKKEKKRREKSTAKQKNKQKNKKTKQQIWLNKLHVFTPKELWVL